jgi:hypothetical protein
MTLARALAAWHFGISPRSRLVSPPIAPRRPRRLLLEPCETCADLLNTLENLLDSMPSPARSARLPENDEDGSTVVWPKWYCEPLGELRKHRPGHITDRCALCGDARTLLVEERPWATPESVACPNCGGISGPPRDVSAPTPNS